MDDVLQRTGREGREPLPTASMVVHGRQLPTRLTQIAKLPERDASRILLGMPEEPELADATLDVECDLLFDVRFDGAVRNHDLSADLGSTMSEWHQRGSHWVASSTRNKPSAYRVSRRAWVRSSARPATVRR